MSSKASGHAMNTPLQFPSHPSIGEVELPFSRGIWLEPETDDGVDPETSLSLSLCISISLLRSYTFFSRSPLVFKTLFEKSQKNTKSRQTGVKPNFVLSFPSIRCTPKSLEASKVSDSKSAIRNDKDLFSSSISFSFPSRCAKRSSTVSFMSELNDNSVPTSTSADDGSVIPRLWSG